MPVYPANGVKQHIFPTSTLGVVSKFDISTKYKEEEEIPDEDGILKYVVGVDNMVDVDVEIVLFLNSALPTALSNIAFNFSGVNSGGSVSYLIRGEVSNKGTAGKAQRVAFKAISNANLP